MNSPPPPTPMSLALALVGLPDVRASTFRAVVDRVAREGLRSLSLSCNAPGLRPRDLGRSARRDVAATLRRADLGCSGVDLFVPPKHLGDPAHSDRALEAYLSAIAFTLDMHELGGAPSVLTTTLPRSQAAQDAISTITDEADRLGVTIADLAWPPIEDAPRAIVPGLDPATIISRDGQVSSIAAQHAKAIATARLSDADDGGRCPVDTGHLDPVSYLLSLHVGGYSGPVVIDVRALHDPWAGVTSAMNAYERMPLPGAGP